MNGEITFGETILPVLFCSANARVLSISDNKSRYIHLRESCVTFSDSKNFYIVVSEN